MKKKFGIFLAVILPIAIFFGCSKNGINQDSQSLKQSINLSSMNLNTALNQISSSEAYSILTVNDGTLKSASLTDSIYKVYIPLDLIKGVYDYKPALRHDRRGMPLPHFFAKTSDDSLMIVRMPLSKAKNPGRLRSYTLADSALVNNFSIAVSAYHNNYNNYHDYDYLLSSVIKIDTVNVGKLDIQSTVSPTKGINYTSQFGFTGSYTAQYKYASGDTTVSSFTISKDNNILYQEKLLTVRNDTVHFGRESTYILSIGNVQITRNSINRSVQIAVNGVLQPNAKVEIVDNDEDSEPSVCKKRDIQITFEDGTVTTISGLIGNSVSNMRNLFTSLHQVYFAAGVVDWIAYDIYYQL